MTLEINFFNILSYVYFLYRSKNITIFAKDDNDFKNEKFKGFMLQIHYDADRYDRDFDNKPIGKFTVPSNAPYKCMDCNGKCDRYSNISNTFSRILHASV